MTDVSYITLYRGETVLVDFSDLSHLMLWKWHGNGDGYASRDKRDPETKKGWSPLPMHREILGAKKGQYVDHKNMQKLDNRSSNLRICSNAENKRNGKAYKGSASGLKGVYVHRQTKKFHAMIRVDGKLKHLGLFKTKEEAHAAFCAAARTHHGEFFNPG
jgi:hypothetical protein